MHSKKYQKLDLDIEQVNHDFIYGYDLYLKQSLGLHKNTINKYPTLLKSLLIRAIAEVLIYKQPNSSFKLVSVKTDREFFKPGRS